jgi:hypothetical protein
MIVNPPASVQVTDGMTSFAHPDDLDPIIFASVISNVTTTNTDTVMFTTDTPKDPCSALTWHIQWENLREDVFTEDVQAKPERDNDTLFLNRLCSSAMYSDERA